MSRVKDINDIKVDEYQMNKDGTKWFYYFSHDKRAPQKAIYKGVVSYYYTPAHSHMEFDPKSTLMNMQYKLYLPIKRKLTDDEEDDIKLKIRKIFIEYGYSPKRVIVQGVSYNGMMLADIYAIDLPMPTKEQIQWLEERMHNEIEIYNT